MANTTRKAARLGVTVALMTTALSGVMAPSALAKPADTLEFVAFNYGYTGVPSTLDAGKYDLAMTNSGTEFHEFVVFSLAEGATATREAAIAAADAQDDNYINRFAGATFAAPGETGDRARKLKIVAGERYVYFCFVGTDVNNTPDDRSDDTPHYQQTPGMVGFINA